MTTTAQPDPQALALPAGVRFDEVHRRDGRTRSHWRLIERALLDAESGTLQRAQDRVRRLLRYLGATPAAVNRPEGPAWPDPLDPIPMVMAGAEWRRLDAGLRQRAHLLDRVLADLYGPRTVVSDGLLPAELLYAHDGFLRCCVGIAPPRWLVTGAVDLVRTPDGHLRVRADWAGSPSGLGEMLSARRVLAQLHPDLFRRLRVERVDAFYATLRSTLASLSMGQGDNPRTVILTPGPEADAFIEHAHLARNLGFTLVEGSDLTVRDGQVWLMSVAGLEQVDVVLRLVDDRWCDPLELRPDSRLGSPGLIEAARRGRVGFANPLGAGILEHPGLAPFLPGLCRSLLGEDLAVPPMPAWWCGEPASRAHVLANLQRMVLRPLAPGTQGGSLPGRHLDAAGREELGARVEARPHLWVGQEEVEASTVPMVHEGRVEAGHLVLRCFLVADGDDYQVMPAGLARATLDGRAPGGPEVVVRKDTWVLSEAPSRLSTHALTLHQVDFGTSLPSRDADALYWIGRHAEAAETAIRLVQTIGRELDETPELATDAGGAWVSTFTACLRWVFENPRIFTGVGASPTEEALTPGDAVAPMLSRALVDEGVPRSLVSSLGQLLRESVAVRELLSTDTCGVLAALEDRLGALRGAATPAETDELASVTLTTLMAFVGLSAESMVRDPGWLFTDIGRRLERARLLVTLLRETLVDEPDPDIAGLVYETLLACCESLVAFRRRYRSDIEVLALASLLVVDPTNPRSLRYQINQLLWDLQRLPGGRQGSAIEPIGRAVELLLTADLPELLVPAGGRRLRLREWLDTLGARLNEAGEAVHLTYFAHVPVRSLSVASLEHQP